MEDWVLLIGWGSPIGIGIFLVCLATMIFILARADAVTKKARRYKKE